MNVVNVIVDLSRQATLLDDTSAWAAPVNYQAVPSQDTAPTGNPLVPQPIAEPEQNDADRPRIGQKENPQRSFFAMQTADPRPWAKYL